METIGRTEGYSDILFCVFAFGGFTGFGLAAVVGHMARVSGLGV